MDVCRRQADSLPGLFSGNEERVIVGVKAIGPMVTLEVVPQVLDRVEFGGNKPAAKAGSRCQALSTRGRDGIPLRPRPARLARRELRPERTARETD